ncbi:chemotaxis protein CheC [Methanogenium organophilum]|uniref:Chemotaxis protein CheC n=1 Tax=Methanogenium organophilum TaxID=2199 RepID=A0A9X9S1Z5_METOG|nr:chemotaxis protein CheC [Methanogenium organophilum]WAI00378.1 chemotaxis protein CheC [Methanogenium organophilum]
MEEISESDMDTLRELINIGIGRAAGILNELTLARVILEVPVVELINRENLGHHAGSFGGATASAVMIDFNGYIAGSTALVFDTPGAAALIYAITGEEFEKPELDVMMRETLKEVGNICINGVMGSIGNILHEHISYTPPRYEEDTVPDLFRHTSISKQMIIIVKTRFLVSEIDVNGYIMMLLEFSSLEKILSKIAETWDGSL